LDTCAVLDLASGRWTEVAAREALIAASYPVVLCVTVWEIARKLRLGKIAMPCDVGGVLEFVRAMCRRHKLDLLPLSAEICQAAELLPAHHEDPFDRMILALAIGEGAPVFTTDRRFLDYPVRVIMPH
jgi:PIN domain nuclease of toxin-antitoxin system